MQAISSTQPSVLLIDEIDRADEAFEAYLLEVLADFQISIPELGTVRATSIPQVILTSNGTRELSDALRRRCLYHFVDYPAIGREIEIVKNALPEATTQLIESAVAFVHTLRKEDLQKIPGIAETLDWICALHEFVPSDLPDDPNLILMTMSCLLKTKSDQWQMSADSVTKLLGGERAARSPLAWRPACRTYSGYAPFSIPGNIRFHRISARPRLCGGHHRTAGHAQHDAAIASDPIPPDPQPGWRAIVCSNKDHWRRYPELFKLYWLPQRVRGSSRISGTTRRSRSLTEMVEALHEQMNSGNAKPAGNPLLGFSDASASANEPGQQNDHAAGGASAVDPLAKKDFGEWLQSDLQQLNRLAEEVAAKVRKRLLRRKQVSNYAHTVNLRSTLRKSVRFGGEPIAPVWQRPRRSTPNLFILVDVSRSMEMYAQLFLRVSRAFCEATRSSAFAFHTRLAEITDLLKKDRGGCRKKINAVTFGFGGGTRIATSLHDFVTLYAKNSLATKSVVLVLSDGYETTCPRNWPACCNRSLPKARRSSGCTLRSGTHFSASLELASLYVNRFIPAHNLESLQKLPDLVY